MEKLTSVLVMVDNARDMAPLDKGIALARAFGASLDVVVNSAADALAVTTHCNLADFRDFGVCALSGAHSAVHDRLLRRVQSHRADLVIKSPTGKHPLRRWTLAANDWQLVSDCPVPVLLARAARWESPLRMAAAVDISDDDNADLARSILQTAGFLALGAYGNLDVLYSESGEVEARLRMQRAVRLAQMVREFHVGCENIRLLEGDPRQELPKAAAAGRYDLFVLGSPPRGEGFAALRTGLASRILDLQQGDVLLVKSGTRQRAVQGYPRLNEPAGCGSG